MPRKISSSLLILVDSFLNHDYTKKDEIKILYIHLIHLLQCNHGSKNENEHLGKPKK